MRSAYKKWNGNIFGLRVPKLMRESCIFLKSSAHFHTIRPIHSCPAGIAMFQQVLTLEQPDRNMPIVADKLHQQRRVRNVTFLVTSLS